MLLLVTTAVFSAPSNKRVYIGNTVYDDGSRLIVETKKNMKVKCNKPCWISSYRTLEMHSNAENSTTYVTNYFACLDTDGTQTCRDEKSTDVMFTLISNTPNPEKLGKKVIGID